MTYRDLNSNDIFNCLSDCWKRYSEVGVNRRRGLILVNIPYSCTSIIISPKGLVYYHKDFESVARKIVENLARTRGIELASKVTEEKFNRAFFEKVGEKREETWLEREAERYKEPDIERKIDGEGWKPDDWDPRSLR